MSLDEFPSYGTAVFTVKDPQIYLMIFEKMLQHTSKLTKEAKTEECTKRVTNLFDL